MSDVSPLSPVLVTIDISPTVGRLCELRKLSELTHKPYKNSRSLSDRRLRLGFFHHRRADGLTFFNELDLAMLSESGSGRDQMTHDHVFLEATQFIDLAQCGRFGQNAGRILE